MPSNLSGIMGMMAWLPYVITAVVLLLAQLFCRAAPVQLRSDPLQSD